MSNVNSVPCELCYSNIVRGIVHKIGSSFVCDDCKQELEKSEGIWFDGHDAEQSMHWTGGESAPLQAESTPEVLSPSLALSTPPTCQ